MADLNPLISPFVEFLPVYFVFSYFLLGALIKFIDDCFDEGLASKTTATLVAVFVAGLWAFNMTLTPASATILAAIVLGVLFKGKVDNIAFKIGVLGIFTILFFFGFFNFLWIPLLVIAIAGVIDEIGNDFVDANNIYSKGILGKLLHFFFEYRVFMKITVFLFAFYGFFEFYYFFAFFAWDLGYILVAKISSHLTHSRKFYYTRNNHSFNGNVK